MAKRMTETTPKADGFRMPAEFEPQAGVWMLWPERPDNWRGGGKPAQRAFCAVAEAIAVSYTHLDVYKRQGLFGEKSTDKV